jgi:hypothetical protein
MYACWDLALLPGDLQYDVHPDFSTTIYPVGSTGAYFSHLQITICAYCLCDLRYTTQLYLIYGHVLYGTPAFIQHMVITRAPIHFTCNSIFRKLNFHLQSTFHLQHSIFSTNVCPNLYLFLIQHRRRRRRLVEPASKPEYPYACNIFSRLTSETETGVLLRLRNGHGRW